MAQFYANNDNTKLHCTVYVAIQFQIQNELEFNLTKLDGMQR